MEISEKIQGILATLPAKPGCYLMKNEAETIIYVGKAISLKNRVRSYFHADNFSTCKKVLDFPTGSYTIQVNHFKRRMPL